jgi:hypothetical protein
MRVSTARLALVTLCVVAAACATSSGRNANDSDTAGGSADGWRPLIDGNLSAWRGYRQQTVPAGWHVADGVLMKDGVTEDLVSRDQFGDYELAWDWKLAPGGNAGVFYRATESGDRVYWTGPEYQLLDDANHPDGRNPLTSAAAAYGLYAAPRGVVKPANEWNSSRIVLRGNHVEHWLNGQKVVEYELASPAWRELVQKSKFNDWPNYGKASRGYIGIQGDHTGALAIRDLRIRTLP